MALNRHLPRGVPPCQLKVKSSANVADLRVRVRVNHNSVYDAHDCVYDAPDCYNTYTCNYVCSMHFSIFICRVIHVLKVAIHPRRHHRLCSDSVNK